MQKNITEDFYIVCFVLRKMRRILFLIVLVCIIPIASASWWTASEEVEVSFDISSQIEVVPTQEDYSLSYISADLSFVPQERSYQDVVQFETAPQAEVNDTHVKFRWDEPSEGDIDFSLQTKVTRTHSVVPIKEKIVFPIVAAIPDDVAKYLEPSETIDSDDERIARLASWIVEGEDDLYMAVFKIADWTNENIDYNLSTLTAEVSQPASWVLENRRGVCDELTSLFIAMLRSVGVPARFVSGIAFTNSDLFPEEWGPHGWAEVYFPDVGWVPYDVTYGEIGYVDPTHITFKESVDGAEPSTQYRWLSRHVDLEVDELSVDTTLEHFSGDFDYGILVSLDTISENIDFGSHIVISGSVENKFDYYVSAQLHLSTPEEIEIIGSREKNVALGPREKREVYFLGRVSDDLSSRYQYTMPLVLNTYQNVNATSTFVVKDGGVFMDEQEARAFVEGKEDETRKVYSRSLGMRCEVSSTAFYSYENETVWCGLKNGGNVYLENIEVCLRSECTDVDLGITHQEDVSFLLPKDVGQNSVVVTAKSEDVSKAETITYEVFDEPHFELQDISIPEEVRFNDAFKLSFMIKKLSRSDGFNASVAISQNDRDNVVTLDRLSSDQPMFIELSGKGLKEGRNTYDIEVTYFDGNGHSYTASDFVHVELVDVSFFQKVEIWLNGVERWLAGL